MLKKEKISSTQLFILVTGYLFGDAIIISPGSGARQDAWLAFLFGWIGGYILIGMYVYIAKLNPSKTLIEISIDIFGQIIGRIIAIMYIWYFLHLSALTFRSFGEYMVVVNYVNTPRIFIGIAFAVVIAIGLKYGIEVIARTITIMSLIVPFTITLMTVMSIKHVDFSNLLPSLKNGVKPIIKSGFGVMTFPFGETIVFLMVFPNLTEKKLFKTSFKAVTIAGIAFILIIIRNIVVLGPNILERSYFSSHVISTIIEGTIIDPFISVSLIILGGIELFILIYATLVGIAQVSNLDDYKPLILPVIIISLSLSNWIYDNLPDMFRVAKEIYPYYAIPFQIIIPLIVLVVSIIRNKKGNKKVLNE
ncbi:GerAB/ArcD/ProY family transporter [Dethiothermospora halolimnae]|uniref:GerAB/ArcD/ProY family transporter n=1 Tax=Dethiothermospora halolimnae TaxID=3114390 RepID=UPI003CCB8729